ncbi:MAG: hypothetical protein Q7S12_00220 [bacterium]|nr:hypothetical protein [bacterium]
MDPANLIGVYVMSVFLSFFLGVFISTIPLWIPAILESIRNRVRDKKIYNYLSSLNKGTLSDNERESFLAQYGHEVGLQTPSHLKCGNSKCGCNFVKVSHHMFWYG